MASSDRVNFKELTVEQQAAVKQIRRKHIISWAIGVGSIIGVGLLGLTLIPSMINGTILMANAGLNILFSAGIPSIGAAAIGAGLGAIVGYRKGSQMSHISKHIEKEMTKETKPEKKSFWKKLKEKFSSKNENISLSAVEEKPVADEKIEIKDVPFREEKTRDTITFEIYPVIGEDGKEKEPKLSIEIPFLKRSDLYVQLSKAMTKDEIKAREWEVWHDDVSIESYSPTGNGLADTEERKKIAISIVDKIFKKERDEEKDEALSH